MEDVFRREYRWIFAGLIMPSLQLSYCTDGIFYQGRSECKRNDLTKNLQNHVLPKIGKRKNPEKSMLIFFALTILERGSEII